MCWVMNTNIISTEHQGAECDLLLLRSGKVKYAVEIKNTLSPKISKGFRISMEDTKAENGILLSRIEESYPLDANIQSMGLGEFLQTVERSS